MDVITASTGCVTDIASFCPHRITSAPPAPCTKRAQFSINGSQLSRFTVPLCPRRHFSSTYARSGSSNNSTHRTSDIRSHDSKRSHDVASATHSLDAVFDRESSSSVDTNDTSVSLIYYLLPFLPLAFFSSSYPAFAASILASSPATPLHSPSSSPQMRFSLHDLFLSPSLSPFHSSLNDTSLHCSPSLALPDSLPLLLASADPSSQSSLSLFQWLQSQLQVAVDLAASSGPAGPVIFISAYIIAAVLFIPGSVLTLAAGYLFGPLQGTAVVSVASTTAAAIAFLIARSVALGPTASRPLTAVFISRSTVFCCCLMRDGRLSEPQAKQPFRRSHQQSVF